MMTIFRAPLFFIGAALGGAGLLSGATLPTGAWSEPEKGYAQESFTLGGGDTRRAGWGGYSPNERRYFDEFLPALFKRTLVIDALAEARGCKWIFTGERASLTIQHGGKGKELKAWIEYHDSPGFTELAAKPGRHPSLIQHEVNFDLPADGGPRALTVKLDHRHNLTVTADGADVLALDWAQTFARHQLQLTGEKGEARFRLLYPITHDVKLTINPGQTHQTMLGWGGIGTATAYRELSAAGRRQWWQWLADYNLLLQREYPVGSELKRDLSNWDDPAAAKAHYYAENFPNGETTDFTYNAALQRFGGFNIFEFWNLPPWVGDSPELYAAAMVDYCRVAQAKTGQAPYAVGVQNETRVKKHLVQPFVTALRAKLDAEGFTAVKIHAANATKISTTIERLDEYRANPEVWDRLDFAASNIYDFQAHFKNPDGLDELLRRWRGLIGDKPFLATEICVNENKYQNDGYLSAFTCAQTYHKLLTLADAVLISYCWTILNVEQPSYAATRSLFAIDRANGFMPKPSSHQLRAYGSFSRRIQRDMVRIAAVTDDADLLVSAFRAPDGRATLVMINRGLSPAKIRLDWVGATLPFAELTDPYHQNEILTGAGGNLREHVVPPGAIVTLSNVPLVKLPAGFETP